VILVDTSVLIDFLRNQQIGKESFERAAMLNARCRTAGVTVRITIENDVFLFSTSGRRSVSVEAVPLTGESWCCTEEILRQNISIEKPF